MACGTLILLAAWFAGIGSHPLYEPDEGRYAEVARQMLATGDWVAPYFDGYRFYDKPPLQYWATALAYRAFGVHEWTARLWSVLTGLLCVVAVGYAGRRVWGVRQGRLAALVCAGSVLVAIGAHVNTLDMGVTAFMTVALAAFLIAQHGCTTTRAHRGWMLATWLAMALGVLSKGLIAIVLPGASLLLYLLWQRGDAGVLRRLQILPGMAILLLIAAPWFVLLARRDSQFLPYFFIHEHLGRFLSKVVDRNHPWWYYLPIIAVGSLPWTPLLWDALRTAWSRSTLGKDGATRLVLAWSAVVLVFFSWSGAKLPLYILPLFPALSLLVAGAAASMPPRAVSRRLLPVAALAILVAAVALWLPHAPALHGRAAYVPLGGPIAVAALLLAAGTCIGAAFAWRGHVDIAIAAAALGGLLFTQGLLQAYQQMGTTASAKPIATSALPYLSPTGPVYAVHDFARGLPFYLRRQVTLVDERPYDMRSGMDWDPQLAIPDEPTFAAAWAQHPDATAIMPARSFTALSGQGLPMRIVASIDDIRIVRHPAPVAAPAQPVPR